MKKVHYLFIILPIFLAILILLVSLQSASKSKFVDQTNLTSRKFYVAKEILPDHSLYPVLMAVDRLRLELSDSEKRISLLVSYGSRRLFYGSKLLDKGNQVLAFTTLSKALKYQNQALEENIVLLERKQNNKELEDQTLAFFVLENFDQQMLVIADCRAKFNDEEKIILESLVLQGVSLADKLQRLIQ
jgi:hypothetical protein